MRLIVIGKRSKRTEDYKNDWVLTLSHLICTLISENEGLEKLRSASNLRKISVPAHLNFFSVCHLSFFQNLYHRSEKNSGDRLKKIVSIVQYSVTSYTMLQTRQTYYPSNILTNKQICHYCTHRGLAS